MGILKWPSKEQLETAEAGYCLAVGQVTVLWTKIHEDLAQMFANRLHANPDQAGIAWYSHKSDSGQRKLFREVLERVPLNGAQHFSTAKDDVLWLMGNLDRLAGVRNHAIHSAVMIIAGENGPEFAPVWWSRDPKLRKLSGRDLVAMLATCRSDLDKLCDFNRSMHSALFAPDKNTWPQRPELSPAQQ